MVQLAWIKALYAGIHIGMLLSGCQGATFRKTLEQVLLHEPVPPRRFNPRVPRDLEAICLRCLRKEPDRRYVSAEALAEDLPSFWLGRPVQARPIHLGGVS
jgi:hypothetical protein